MKPLIAACAVATVLGANAALAGTFLRGTYIDRHQESLIAIGMKCDEVHGLLGNPATHFDYRSSDGPTWTYYLIGSSPGTLVFVIEFNAGCRVVSKGEKLIPQGS
jgi:outer membrane protein assembly factor BamE (lipoprotein component of BamABCDE complex)